MRLAFDEVSLLGIGGGFIGLLRPELYERIRGALTGKAHASTFWYEGADHGFLAYTRPYYKPDLAKLAWARTTRFLQTHLK